MSILLMEELRPGVVLIQNFTIKRDLAIAHIRPWIYKQGTLVDGDFTIRIKQGSTVLKEVSINFVDINAAIPEDFAHGFIRFDMDPLILHKGAGVSEEPYIMEFEMANHTLDGGNFLAMNRSWENQIYDLNYTPGNDVAKPQGVEIYEIKML